MYSCVKLNKKNLSNFIELNKNKDLFNVLNEDFFKLYNESNLFYRFFLRKRVTLLKSDKEYIGYIWATISSKKTYTINAMNIKSNYLSLDNYAILLKTLKENYIITYLVQKNSYNMPILKELGFAIDEGTLKLELCLNNIPNFDISNDIDFEVFIKGKHEEIRCNIQNEVFKNDSRIPLTLLDIQMDELQDYYVDKGAILVKKDNVYIGYGQIILESENPTIVNLGILKEYRGKKYGKSLLLYLLRLVKLNGYNKTFLKVSYNNIEALNLYRSLGFTVETETYKFELRHPKI